MYVHTYIPRCVHKTHTHTHLMYLLPDLERKSTYIHTYIHYTLYIIHSYIHTYIHTYIHPSIHTYIHYTYIHTYLYVCIPLWYHFINLCYVWTMVIKSLLHLERRGLNEGCCFFVFWALVVLCQTQQTTNTFEWLFFFLFL